MGEGREVVDVQSLVVLEEEEVLERDVVDSEGAPWPYGSDSAHRTPRLMDAPTTSSKGHKRILWS